MGKRIAQVSDRQIANRPQRQLAIQSFGMRR
jgi:hypothetical protein